MTTWRPIAEMPKETGRRLLVGGWRHFTDPSDVFVYGTTYWAKYEIAVLADGRFLDQRDGETEPALDSYVTHFIDLTPPAEHPVAAAGRKMVYVAGPYTNPADQRQYRFEALTRAAVEEMRAGNLVYSPITHSHLLDVVLAQDTAEGTLGSDFWVAMDEHFMSICDECVVVMLPGWRESRGVAFEINHFTAAGKPVRYTEPSPFVLGQTA